MVNLKIKCNKQSLYLFFFPSIFASGLAYLSYIQFFGISRDYLEYKDTFLLIIEKGCGSLGDDSRIEIGFQLSTCFVSTFLRSPELIYAFYVFVCLFIKFYIFLVISFKSKNFTISKQKPLLYSRTFFLSLVLYVFAYFVVSELTQIRNSLAFSFLLLSVITFVDIIIDTKKISKRNFLLKVILGLLLWGCSISLHNSSYLLTPFIVVAFFVKKTRHLVFVIILAYLYCWYGIPSIANFLLDSGNKAALIYSIDDLNKQNLGFGNLSFALIFRVLFLVVGFFLIFILKAKNTQQHQIKMVFYSLYLFSLICLISLIMRPLYIQYLLRSEYYLQVFSVCLVASMTSQKELCFTFPWVLVLSVFNFYYSMSGNYFS